MLAPSAESTSSSAQTLPGTVKQRLAAIRELFDWLIFGQVLGVNPTAAVRRPKALVTSGQTPVLTAEQTPVLLNSTRTTRHDAKPWRRPRRASGVPDATWLHPIARRAE